MEALMQINVFKTQTYLCAQCDPCKAVIPYVFWMGGAPPGVETKNYTHLKPDRKVIENVLIPKGASLREIQVP